MDTVLLRSILNKSGELTNEELATITAENAEAYLQRLKDRDARFHYTITIALEHGTNPPPTPPGALATLTHEHATIAIFPRDLAALRRDPPRVTFTIQDHGIKKFEEFIRTGKTQELTPGELTGLRADPCFLIPDEIDTSQLRLLLTPTPQPHTVPLRVTFGSPPQQLVYEYVPCNISRAGTDEIELTSTTEAPFYFRTVIGIDGTGYATVNHPLTGDVHGVQRYLTAIRALTNSGKIELYNLTHAARIGQAIIDATEPEWLSPYEALINDAVTVADHYHTTLTINKPPSIGDAATITILKGLINGTTIPIETITMRMTKIIEPTPEIERALHEARAYQFVHNPFFKRLVVFGTTVITGPVQVDVPRATITNADEFTRFLRTAAIGEDDELQLKPTAPASIRLAQQQPSEVEEAQRGKQDPPTIDQTTETASTALDKKL
jgi:hypothetical protein